jgi:hypothetical protein
MTKVVEPVCGFTWGYEIRNGLPSATSLAAATRADWLDATEALRSQVPGWKFGGAGWEPPSFGG